jgi:hypothetical protein
MDDATQSLSRGNGSQGGWRERGGSVRRRIDANRGRCRVTVKVELGGDEAIQVEFQGRDAPIVSYEFIDPADVLAIGKALVKAADLASAAVGTETG